MAYSKCNAHDFSWQDVSPCGISFTYVGVLSSRASVLETLLTAHRRHETDATEKDIQDAGRLSGCR